MKPPTTKIALTGFILMVLTPSYLPAQTPGNSEPLSYAIVGTGQAKCYDNSRQIDPPKPGQPFYGQDAQNKGYQPSYTLSADGRAVQDNVTGLTWQQSADANGDGVLDHTDKLTWKEAEALPARINAEKFGGFNDWRLPTIKELYSLILFGGLDPSGPGMTNAQLPPFIDTGYFKFVYGDTAAGERIIDAQYWSSTRYVGPSRDGKIFGVNFADGRIKGYPGNWARQYVLCVRGNPRYGPNDLRDNADGTVTDRATGLMWSKADSGKGMNWEQALACAANSNLAGHSDWRLPNAKELQSIVDYTRSPDTTNSAAIDPVFSCTAITNEVGQTDYPFYWTGTTHASLGGGSNAVYVAFGRAASWMSGQSGRANSRGDGLWNSGGGDYQFIDVHGAGAQRSDPKSGNPADFPHGRGPQGDVIRINNYVRLVRHVDPTSLRLAGPDATPRKALRVSEESAGGPREDVGPLGGGRPSSPGGFRLIPPFVMEQLDLTAEQEQKIVELEKEFRAKLDQILTPQQRKVLDEARPPRLGPGEGRRGPGSGSRGGARGPIGGQDGPERPPQ